MPNYKLKLIKDTKEDFDKYNEDYYKACKLFYKIGNHNFKCNYCLENHKAKFFINLLKK